VPKVRILNWLRGERWAPSYKPGKYSSKPFRGASPLPISVVAAPEEDREEIETERPSALAPKSSLISQESFDEEPEEEPPIDGSVRPFATDLRRYLP
jgi:hypothetical protein